MNTRVYGWEPWMQTLLCYAKTGELDLMCDEQPHIAGRRISAEWSADASVLAVYRFGSLYDCVSSRRVQAQSLEDAEYIFAVNKRAEVR